MLVRQGDRTYLEARAKAEPADDVLIARLLHASCRKSG